MIVILDIVKSTHENKKSNQYRTNNSFFIIIFESAWHNRHDFVTMQVSYGDSKVIWKHLNLRIESNGGFNDIDKEIWLFKILKF